ncbi:hypothetical protein V8F33_002977 [Rhypophila sp. PSN 637]
MMRTAICFMAFMAFMSGLVLGLDAPIPGYTVVDLVWSVDAFGNGTIVNITGPVEKVYDELKRINAISITSLPEAPANIDNITLSQDLSQAINCVGPWETANVGRIREGISHLKGVPGKPANSPGPGSCGRVSCSYQSAIWWCNDNKFTKTLDSFGAIGDCAQTIIDACHPTNDKIVGQNFKDGNWNCIIRRDNC